MQISLRAMDEAAFSSYLEIAVGAYAKDNVDSDRWDESEAFARAEIAYETLLPQGLATTGNHLFNIVTDAGDVSIGHVWVKFENNEKSISAFIYDIEIHESYRRNGFAKKALKLIEAFAEKSGATRIGLHVFHSNSAAIELYNGAGYQNQSYNMQKSIGKHRRS